MAAIICELCGSNDIQKQDGLFVCQHGRKIIRAILTTIMISAIALCLIGCGNKEELKFRNIPFGTKYGDAISKLSKDLEGQNYTEESHEITSSTGCLVIYHDVRLYDYSTTMFLNFVKGEKESINESVLYDGLYSIEIDEVAANKQIEKLNSCYDFFFSKLTELYGKSKETDDGVEWIKGDTICSLSKHEDSIVIDYWSDSVYKQFEQVLSDESAHVENSINSGL